MVRLLGLGRKKASKKRLSPSARTPEGRREKHPMYEYAVQEYSQTVAAGTSNDDGKGIVVDNVDINVDDDAINVEHSAASGSWHDEEALPRAPSSINSSRQPQLTDSALQNTNRGPLAVTSSTESTDNVSNVSVRAAPTESDVNSIYSPHRRRIYNSHHTNHMMLRATRSPFENDLPDTVYEEHYGEAYTGGPLKFVYPSGYTNMRPRSGPWRLSIVVCLLFTWLCIFIVGHCSDQVDQSQFSEIDDDAVVLDIRWCGSRPLYLLWATSMLITAASAAYCGVIGYIKVRDFTVANSRSQPPGISEGKSDYYVRIEDNNVPFPRSSASNSESSYNNQGDQYKPSIYQADGTPQFWGSHIYRPTQAAVAITSR